MSISDEELMAYVDGELAVGRRAAIEAAAAADPKLAQRIVRHWAMRDQLRRAFDVVLDEPVPERLVVATRGLPVSRIPDAGTRRRQPRPVAWYWLAAAASLVLGVLVGPWIPRLAGGGPDFVAQGAVLAASGDLATALTDQLAAGQSPTDRIRLLVSYVANSGEYCRAFVAHREDSSIAGIACRDGGAWRIRSLDSGPNAHGEVGDYRQAATSLSPLILQAIEAGMVGQPLDAAGEARARRRDWTVQATGSQ